MSKNYEKKIKPLTKFIKMR